MHPMRLLRRLSLGAAWLLGLAIVAAAGMPVAHRVGQDYHLENGRICLVLAASDAGYVEILYTATATGWHPVLAGTGPAGETLRCRYDLAEVRPVYTSVGILMHPAGAALELLASVGPHRIRTVVSLLPGAWLLDYRVELQASGRLYLESLESEYRFLPAQPPAGPIPLDCGWCPGQRLGGGRVLGDQLFHSPLALMQRGGHVGALIAEVHGIPASRLFKTAMRYHAGTNARSTGPWFSYGLMDYALDGYVHFRHTPAMIYRLPASAIAFGYRLGAASGVAAGGGLDLAARALWARLGAPRVAGSTWPQFAPFPRLARAAYDWAFRSPYASAVWEEFRFGGREAGGTHGYITFDRQRKGQAVRDPEQDGIYFQSWFNNLHSAFGMHLMGLKWNDGELVRRAERIKNLVLTAPLDRGLFPAVFDPTPDEPAAGRWRSPTPFVPDRRRADDFYYHLPDAAWTGYWMLRWFATVQGDGELAWRAKLLADRLVLLQRPSGALPSWLARGTLQPAPELLESAATAAGALFLVRAHTVLHDAWYLAAACRALNFLEREVIPESKWFDFESEIFAGGAPLAQRDPDTGLHDATTLSMIWAAQAFAEAYEITRDPGRLQSGLRVLDELSLYQHLWDKPWQLDIPSFGGFTAQNRDAEQNDARQALAAPLFLHYYRLTGREELFHRGVAALRAAFTNMYLRENVPVWKVLNQMFPWFGPADHGFMEENAFHNGDPGMPFVMRACNFNWGPGSAAAAAAEIELRYGGIYVDLGRDRAFGLDGCLAEFRRMAADEVRVTVHETLGEARAVRLVVEGVPAGKALWIAAATRTTAHGLEAPQAVPLVGDLGAATVSLPAHGAAAFLLWLR
ncbi:MAG: hypothetical protein JXQ29_01445 [Planctomycetes bacterium]|nr:hypothetical protein [Planctomycetota bacterium]